MKWRALILGGGGSTGEFQIGALQVLAQHYDSFNMYVGVGVGSLNSGVLAQYPNFNDGYKALLDVWSTLKSTKDVFDIPFLGVGPAALAAFASDKKWARDGIYGSKSLRKLIGQSIDWERLKDKANWAVETTCLSDGQLYTITNNKELLKADTNPKRHVSFSLDPASPFYIGNSIQDLMTGAGSVPMMLAPVDIFGLRFAEGGLRDFTPLELAVKAFELARAQGFTEAEFIVVDNYTNEIAFENPDLLDSGLEIMMRTVKIMTVEMAQNDIFRGKTRLEKLGVTPNVLLIQPIVDFRLNPMNFDDMATRQAMRNHGVSRATLLVSPSVSGAAEALAANMISAPTDFNSLLNAFINDPENTAYADKIVDLALEDHELALESMQERAPFSDFGLVAETVADDRSEKPGNLQELIDLMKSAQRANKPIKAVGSGYAFDHILDTTGVQVSLANLHNMWIPDGTFLKDPSTVNSLLEFEAGATIEQLTTFLWAQDKALLNQPGYEGLSFIGVASVGGHGSGIEIQPIADAILAIHLLTFDDHGNFVQKRIEPKNGITNPTLFKAQFPAIQLIQDDNTFNASKVSVGCMGIIYSVVIKTQANFYLEERRTLEKWSELKTLLPGKLKDKSIHSIHVWFNPYVFKDDIGCVLSEYRLNPGPPKGKRRQGVTSGLVPKLGPVILWFMEHFPKQLPAIMNSSLKATVNRGPVVMPCYEALNFGTPNLVPVDATNCGVPADNVIEVADRLLKLAAERYETGAYITCPIGFRFTAPTDSLLAPQYKRSSCMIELPLIRPTPQASETIDAFLQLLMGEFNGRPHYGQRFNQNINLATMKKMYPMLDTFKTIFKELNPGTFDNAFTVQAGLRA